jgi:hypothetical protein
LYEIGGKTMSAKVVFAAAIGRLIFDFLSTFKNAWNVDKNVTA